MYSQYFQKFLQHTDEEAVLLRHIQRVIDDVNPCSLLDIGAGNGDLSIPLARSVDHYVAIERNRDHIKRLEGGGIPVVPEEFPCEVDEAFDFVLASHVLSYRSTADQTSFLEKAWGCLEDAGTFLVVTYRSDQEDDWTQLMLSIGMDTAFSHAAGFRNTLTTLKGLGEVTVSHVGTWVYAAELGDILEALAFVASDGKPEVADNFLRCEAQLHEIFTEKYLQDGTFRFPFEHFFLKATKQP